MPCVQIGEQRGHLFLGKAASKAGHHSLPCKNILPYSHVRRRSAAGKGLAIKEAMQVWWDLLEDQVVVFVAVGTSNLVEMFTFGFLRGECRSGVTAGEAEQRPQANYLPCAES